MRLSAHEQHLLDFAREQFSKYLSRFLLFGLGEEQAGQRWHFTIAYTGDKGAVMERQLEVITYEPTDGSTYLPQRRDPLVLLSLLHLLLHSDHESPNRLRYEQKSVLSLLGWDDTSQTREEIDKAIERYSLLMYKWKMNDSDLARSNLSFHTTRECLISEYEVLDEETEDSGQVERVFNQVVFNAYFIEHLMGRSLFGIEWNNVRSLLRQFPSRK